MELFTFLSDSKVQDSSVVNYNMDKLILYLKDKGVMKHGDRLLTNSDVCAAQYRCSTAFFFLSFLAYKHGIEIDRAISCPGHGKDIVDGVNGTTKTDLTRLSGHQLKTSAEVDDVSAVDTKKFAAAVMQGTKGCSPALECKRLLEFEGTSGKKSNRKNNKRENSRAIQRMHYWVRGGTEKLNESKCKPAKLPKGEKIRDHYHIYCCPELGLGRGVALRKIPCKCIACNNQMKKKWIHNIHDNQQPRLQVAE
mmetsp:Transcript_20210/g.45217  ORF Transcript_20210/g.45217 Transcript_20210/m.45217 type:complete len:251 (+) Transcript_20210:988-1740(+)